MLFYAVNKSHEFTGVLIFYSNLKYMLPRSNKIRFTIFGQLYKYILNLQV
jgi:hypothetical protein